jgi:hypothetical protein
MKITIDYPQVMKMQMSTTIEVSNSTTLQEIKTIILKSFWDYFTTVFQTKVTIHGTIKDISLKSRDIEIVSEIDLQHYLDKPEGALTALFKVHPLSGVSLGKE